MAIVTSTFTSSGSWTAPAGVTHVILWGMGGGGGGAGGESNGTTASGGATGASLGYQMVAVTPNTTYTVTIGAGGVGAAADTTGVDGDNTTFGALHTFHGAYRGTYLDTANTIGMSGGAGTDTGGQNSYSPYGYATSSGGPSGGAGGRGVGGSASNTEGTAGSNAAANTGGGGGTGKFNSVGTGGAGGNGGSGWLQIIWFEG